MVFLPPAPRSLSLFAFCALFATVGSGCVPPDSGQFSKPVASPLASSEPVVLNGAGGKISGSAAKTKAKGDAAASAAMPADAAAKSAGKTDEPPSPAAAPVLAAKPLTPVAETPAVAVAPPDPAAAAADQTIGKNADGYPNINAPPKEPASSLLPADERARVISELEALRNHQGGAVAKDSGGAAVAKKGSAKAKPDGKCPEGATPATDADCKPVSSNQ